MRTFSCDQFIADKQKDGYNVDRFTNNICNIPLELDGCEETVARQRLKKLEPIIKDEWFKEETK